MPVTPATPDELDELGKLIVSWSERELAGLEMVLAIDQLPEERRWFIRLQGEQKQFTTIWFHLRERTLHFETQFMPAPEENVEALYDYLLRLNSRLFLVRFSIGWEDAIYLEGQLPWSAVDEDELDRIVGSIYSYAERYFRPAMRLGYASKFKG